MIDADSIKPTKGKIFGQILDGDYVTESGIIVVNSLKRKKPRCILVLAVGDAFCDKKGKPQTYRARPGQTAYFKLAAGKELTIDRKRYLIIENEDIVAVDS